MPKQQETGHAALGLMGASIAEQRMGRPKKTDNTKISLARESKRVAGCEVTYVRKFTKV